MLLARLLNACHHFPGFVYAAVRLIEATSTIEVDVRPRRGSKPHCSCCGNIAPGYDVLAVRRFEFIPIWGTTPQVFWSAVRVEEAIRRLALRDEPLTSVAMELGFSTPGNFSRFFREHRGVSPSRYRRVAAGPQLHPITGIP